MTREERQTIHTELCRLARHKGAYDAEEAYWLRKIQPEIYQPLGYASALEYLERLFGYPPRQAKERLRVADALSESPRLEGALGEGALSWTAVRELTRVATPETEEVWIAEAAGRTVREIERMVSGKKPGDRPEDLPEPGARRQTLVLELSAETFALFREARKHIEEQAGGAGSATAASSMAPARSSRSSRRSSSRRGATPRRSAPFVKMTRPTWVDRRALRRPSRSGSVGS